MNPYFPFHALGYRCNPFRALTDEEWEAVAVLPAEIERLLPDRFAHLQVLGEKGRGKSTTLRALAARFRREGRRAAYEYLPEGERRFGTDLRTLELFLVDEAQRLSSPERRRLLSAAARGALRLVLGSHQDFTPLFRKHRLELTSVSLDFPCEEHFQAVLARRLEHFALHGVPRATLAPEAVCRLRDRFGSDLRGAELFLYELYQERTSPEEITEQDVRIPVTPLPAP